MGLDYYRGEGSSIGTYYRSQGGSSEPTEKDRMLVEKIGLSIFQGTVYFCVWLGLLVGSITIVLMTNSSNLMLDMFEVFFRVGSLAFLGAVTNGFPGSLVASAGIFGPGFIL